MQAPNTNRRASLCSAMVQAARCEHDIECLSGESGCRTARFVNRDVEVLRCLCDRPCGMRRSCDGMQICTCPVMHRLEGL
jgi:hypothetical protein